MVAQELEDVCKSRRTRDYEPPRTSGSNQAIWTFKCLVRPWLLRLAALALAFLSLSLIFAEATIGAGRHPDLSPFSIMVHADQSRGEISLQLLVLLPLVCAPPSMSPKGEEEPSMGAARRGEERKYHRS